MFFKAYLTSRVIKRKLKETSLRDIPNITFTAIFHLENNPLKSDQYLVLSGYQQSASLMYAVPVRNFQHTSKNFIVMLVFKITIINKQSKILDYDITTNK